MKYSTHLQISILILEYLIKELEKEKTGLTDTIEKQSSKHIQRNPNAARNHLHPIGTITDGQIKVGNNAHYVCLSEG